MSRHIVRLSIAAAHPAYAGHFSGRPILPGVVLLDAAIQAFAVTHANANANANARMQFKSAKFLRPVLPGETLYLHYEETPSGDLHFEIHGGDRKVASGIFAMATISP